MTGDTVETTCRAGHTRVYPGPGGRSVKCRECRVSVHLPVQRTAPRARGGLTALEALWASERPPKSLLEGVDPCDDPCPKCGEPLEWEGRRTLTYCRPCDTIHFPPFVLDRHEQRQAPSGKASAREVAVRGPSQAELRQAEAVLAGHRATVADGIRKALAALRSDDLPDSVIQGEAVRWHGALSSYLGHVQDAETTEALGEIREEILSLAPQFQQVAEHVRQERDRQDRARRLWEEQEAEERRAIEAEKSYIAYEEPNPAPLRPLPSGSTYAPTAVMVAQGMRYLAERSEAKRERRETVGECPFRHHRRPIASFRMFPTYSQSSSAQLPGSQDLRVCAKHRGEAMQWFGQQGYSWVETEEL